jgi:type IV pilus assembly protein PilE
MTFDKKKNSGMTLIELMVVVAIVGIISAIAFPSYQEYVRTANRADGMALINQIMQAQERYFVNTYTYATDLQLLGFTTAAAIDSEGGKYKVTATVCGAAIAITTCVLLTAVPQGAQASDGDLSLNSQGKAEGHW